jgi:hypothetical protein
MIAPTQLKVAAMRLPWSTTRRDKPADPVPVSKSEAALSGPAGDGKVHDLAYWIESGFLTLPRPDPDWPAPPESGGPA